VRSARSRRRSCVRLTSRKFTGSVNGETGVAARCAAETFLSQSAVGTFVIRPSSTPGEFRAVLGASCWLTNRCSRFARRLRRNCADCKTRLTLVAALTRCVRLGLALSQKNEDGEIFHARILCIRRGGQVRKKIESATSAAVGVLLRFANADWCCFRDCNSCGL
jgi:hypothetical protein